MLAIGLTQNVYNGRLEIDCYKYVVAGATEYVLY